MYTVGNEITVTWVIPPTDIPLVASDYDIRVIPSGLNGSYTDAGITNYVAPSEFYAGSMTYTFTPTSIGRFQLWLSTGTGLRYKILNKKNFWVFASSPVSAASTRAISSIRRPGVIPPWSFVLTVGTLGAPNFQTGMISTNAYGNLSPGVIGNSDEVVEHFYAGEFSGGFLIFQLVNSTTIDGIGTNALTVNMEGYQNNPISMPWVGPASAYYTAADGTAYWNFLDDVLKLGSGVVNVTIEDSGAP